jgi:hypothetical protein
VSEYVTKRVQITVKRGLPMGLHASFTYEGEPWVAHPAWKYRRIVSVLDRLIGLQAGIHHEMMRWIKARPQDTDLVVRVIERLARGRRIQQELIEDKVRTQTA